MRLKLDRHVTLAWWLLATTLVLPVYAQSQPGRNEGQREQWQKVDDIFAAMQVKPGAVVADVGAGDGFFTRRLSAAVGAEGKVMAIDIAPDALGRLRKRVADEGLTNVQVIEAVPDDPRLAPGSIDAALIVNAYHEMTEHQAVLAKIKAALKPGGRLVIVEPISAARRDGRREDQARNHEISPDFVREDARAAGFTQVQLHDPFTHRPQGNDDEWLLALTPAAASTGAGPTPPAPANDPEKFSSKNEEWKSPALRIQVDEFKRQVEGGRVLVLDVRDPQSYAQGHLPGAVLMTPEELATPEGRAKLQGETRLIVAYCS